MTKAKVIRRVRDLLPDDRNANKGTERGAALLEKSLQQFGAGRSVLVDRDGRVIAGNKTLEGAAALGIDDVVVVQTDGKKLVVVQRLDLDLQKDRRARELAIADNRTNQINLDWDAAVLRDLGKEGINLSQFWGDAALAKIFKSGEDAETILDQAIQLKPAREYVVVVCDEGNPEWEKLRAALGLKFVRRGGYKRGSPFDAVAINRVVKAKDLLRRMKK